MTKPSQLCRARIGMLGSGTVGEAVQDLVFDGILEKKLGVSLEIVKIFTPHPQRKSRYTTHRDLFTTRPADVTDHPDADIIVEVLGSQDGEDLPVFRDLVIRALQKGKSVVTSDKAVLAGYGREIWRAAREHDRQVRFEACVGGGIPIIRSLTEGLCAEEPEAIYGIVNGTCNYILTEMNRGGRSYEESLRQAQQRGYAETDPAADTSGRDAEAKLILLAAVAFGVQLAPGLLWRQGIEKIHPVDFQYARRKASSTIKHLAVARKDGAALEAFVSPAVVPDDHFLSTIDGITNAIFFKGKRSWQGPADGEPGSRERSEGRDWNYVFVGPGAGGGPTAVAVLGDVCELARSGRQSGPPAFFGRDAGTVHAEDQIRACFYVRFVVKDQSGIVGDICQIFGDERINVSEVWQLSHSQEELRDLVEKYHLGEKAGSVLPFAITLERTTVGQLKRALDIIGKKDFILVEPVWLPVWRG